jgi:hypothetical protein
MAADTEATTALRFTVPIFATPAWIRAVTAASGLCQCTGQCGRKHAHTSTPGRCDARQGAPGVMLHLTEAGAVYCLRCFASIERAAKQSAAVADARSNADQLDLFALLD